MHVWQIRALVGTAAAALALTMPALTMPGIAAARGVASTRSSSAARAVGNCGGETLPPDPAGGQWRCTFDDEFDSTTGDASSLNTSWWTPQVTATSGYTTGQWPYVACYVDSPDTISVSGGALHLTVREQSTPFQCGALSARYAAGMITTASKFDQTYGRFEVRALLPQTVLPGLQETLWLYPQSLTYGPWPASGEVDFSEFYSLYSVLDVPYIHYNYDPSVTDLLSGTNTTTAYCPINPAQYNDYAVIWEPGTFTITINGNTCLVDRYRASGGLAPPAPFDRPFFIALTQALGAGLNAYDPLLTPLPATMSIDYVRAWTGSGPAGAHSSPPRPALSALRVSPRAFALTGRLINGRCVAASGALGRRRRCSRPVRLRIFYRLSAPAKVTITIARRRPGRLLKGRCVLANRKHRGRRRCIRLTPVRGVIRVKGRQGANSLTFDGRIGGRELGAGSYRLTATPTAGGRAGTPRSISFTLTV